MKVLNKTKLKLRTLRRSLIAVGLVSIPSIAFAATAFDCVSEQDQLVGCASIPPEAPETSASESAAAVEHAPAKTSLLSRTELSGGAVVATNRRSHVNDLSLTAVDEEDGSVIRSPHGSVNTALLAAIETEAQLRRIDLFLKSGAGSHSDLGGIEVGKPGSPQK